MGAITKAEWVQIIEAMYSSDIEGSMLLMDQRFGQTPGFVLKLQGVPRGYDAFRFWLITMRPLMEYDLLGVYGYLSEAGEVVDKVSCCCYTLSHKMDEDQPAPGHLLPKACTEQFIEAVVDKSGRFLCLSVSYQQVSDYGNEPLWYPPRETGPNFAKTAWSKSAYRAMLVHLFEGPFDCPVDFVNQYCAPHSFVWRLHGILRNKKELEEWRRSLRHAYKLLDIHWFCSSGNALSVGFYLLVQESHDKTWSRFEHIDAVSLDPSSGLIESINTLAREMEEEESFFSWPTR